MIPVGIDLLILLITCFDPGYGATQQPEIDEGRAGNPFQTKIEAAKRATHFEGRWEAAAP